MWLLLLGIVPFAVFAFRSAIGLKHYWWATLVAASRVAGPLGIVASAWARRARTRPTDAEPRVSPISRHNS